MIPEAFRKRLLLQKFIDADKLIDALQHPSPVSIRLNKEKWEFTPLNGEQVKWCNEGFYLPERPKYTLDPVFHAGCYYSQEASGMFLGEVFKQVVEKKEGIKVLDLCGAPGGKSTQLSSLIGTESLLVANEVIRGRASVLAENLTKWGLSNSIVTQSDPSLFASLPSFFDLVLVDAPCSGEGMFRDEVAVNEWSVDNTLLCSDRQKRIIMDVWPSLKDNGILVYSTCTFNPAENEENIKWFTEKLDAESVQLNISGFNGITEINYNNITGYGFYPGSIKGEGLFVSVLRKKGERQRSSGKQRLANDKRVTRADISLAAEWSTFAEDRILKLNDDVISIPCSYGEFMMLSAKLRIVRQGTKICTVKAKNAIPSHDMALSIFRRKNSFPVTEVDVRKALEFLHRDNINVKCESRGWNIISYKGIALGFVNNLGSRLNNYYPSEWRIRMQLPEELTGILWKSDK